MHYLVTGAAGFIDSHLVEAHLVQGNQISIIDDVYTPEIKRHNIAGTFHFLEACRNHGAKKSPFSEPNPPRS
ncbi:MAG: hypothetical protein ABF382_00895 [Akkermansiaceae bacterium]